MEIYNFGWWELTGELIRSWEWQEISVKAYNEIHMISQIDKSVIKRIEKGRKEGTVRGAFYHSRKPTFLERFVYI